MLLACLSLLFPSLTLLAARPFSDQEAATLWYHDHAMGITRLNVFAGLAGFFVIRDERERKLQRTGVLPSGQFEQMLVFQDRWYKPLSGE